MYGMVQERWRIVIRSSDNTVIVGAVIVQEPQNMTHWIIIFIYKRYIALGILMSVAVIPLVTSVYYLFMHPTL